MVTGEALELCFKHPKYACSYFAWLENRAGNLRLVSQYLSWEAALFCRIPLNVTARQNYSERFSNTFQKSSFICIFNILGILCFFKIFFLSCQLCTCDSSGRPKSKLGHCGAETHGGIKNLHHQKQPLQPAPRIALQFLYLCTSFNSPHVPPRGISAFYAASPTANPTKTFPFGLRMRYWFINHLKRREESELAEFGLSECFENEFVA